MYILNNEWNTLINENGEIIQEENLSKMCDILSGIKGIVYCYNLPDLFQLLRNYVELDNVFSRKKRDVLKCGMKGSDVELRSIKALLNDEPEINEIMEELKELKKKYKRECWIPYTSTSCLRKDFQKKLKSEYKNDGYGLIDWNEKVKKLTPDFYTFHDLVECFMGGYLCSNYIYKNKVIENVKSFDFDSSYIYVMLSEKFPMKRFKRYQLNSLDDITEDNAYIIEITFYNYMSMGCVDYIPSWKIDFSKSKYINTEDGKVTSADKLTIKCNEIDIKCIMMSSKFSHYDILNCKISKKEYLPKILRDFIRDEYIKKEQLKPYKKQFPKEYKRQKRRVNCIYGMSVTNYIRDICEYRDNNWFEQALTPLDIDSKLLDMRSRKPPLLPYQWGVWVTSYARYNIWKNVVALDDALVYSDTDSVKYVGEHTDIINQYNTEAENKLKQAFIDCNEKYTEDFLHLGKFEKEETAKEFKTLGPKKYISKYKDRIELTVAGLNKEKSVEALKDINEFKIGFVFSPEYSGKVQKEYIDEIGNYRVKTTEVPYKIQELDEMMVSSNKCKLLERGN